MDTLRGNFGSGEHDERHDLDQSDELDTATDDSAATRDLPPAAIGQDERRMQVRAYNHWAGLLGDRTYPSIEDLEPEALPDFGPHSVLLDFSAGIEDPTVHFLGEKLANECGTDGPVERLSDVPPRSLLSRITDHYMQIMANEAPIGFEAEFVNQRGNSILYRGILLPFSSDDETIDFIYGVINWKEMADAATADELLLEIDQALNADNSKSHMSDSLRHHDDPIADWADSPAHEAGEEEPPAFITPSADMLSDNIADFDGQSDTHNNSDNSELPMPNFGQSDFSEPDFEQYALEDPYEEEEETENDPDYGFASLADYIEAPVKKAVDLDADEFDPEDYRVEEAPSLQNIAYDENVEVDVPELADDADIHDCLAAARELANNARTSEDRSRHALYAAVGRAYDFSLAAKDAPEDYDELIAESGLTVQERAPMTPVVKLVFGSDYDKTRLTEYAAVLNHAHRLELGRGALADFLAKADGGLKGVVNAERRLRREESGKVVEGEHAIREALAQKLRELEAMILDAKGPEFSLVMMRRGSGEDGSAIEMVGEISDDIALIERAARRLVA